MRKQTGFLLAVAAFGLCLASGCDRTGQLAESDRIPARAGKMINQNARTDEAAVDLLEKCAAAYKRLSSYEDSARVVLGYKVDGQPHQDVAPLSVAFESPARLGLKAYQVIAGPTENRFRLRVTGQTEGATALGRQVISRALPTSLSAGWLMSDSVVAGNLSGGLAGAPPQLELLLGDEPFRALLEGATAITIDGQGKEAGQSFQIVAVARGEARYRLWISATSGLLRRIELPSAALPPVMLSDKHLSELHLSIELDDPKVGSRIDWGKWQVPTTPQDQLVRYFVHAPEVELDNRLGKSVPAFRLEGVAGSQTLDTSASARSGKTQVLVWIADHAACRATLEQINSALQSLPSNLKDQVAARAIWAEEDPPEGLTWQSLVEQWQMKMPIAQDLEAVGRDTLGISEAPTLVILDAQHRLQLLQSGANPYLSEALPALLARLASGENLAEGMVQKNARERERFSAELWLARASDASPGAFTQPTSYPPGQLTLKQVHSVKPNSQVLSFQTDTANNLWLLNQRGQLIRYSTDGQQKQVLDTGWTPAADRGDAPIRMALDASGKSVALAGHTAGELLVLDISSGKHSTVNVRQAKINDLRWLDTQAGLRLAAITDTGRTLLIDPSRADQHSGQSRTEPLAILPRPKTETLASGFVIMNTGRVEPIIVEDEGGARAAALAKPASVVTSSTKNQADDPLAEHQLKFAPARGPWSPWNYNGHAITLARGWTASDEPAVFLLDEQLRQQWHAPLAIDSVNESMLISVAEDPLSGAALWVLSTGNKRVHFFSADGRLVDHCQLDSDVRGLGLVPVGKELQLWVAHEDKLVQYGVR